MGRRTYEVSSWCYHSKWIHPGTRCSGQMQRVRQWGLEYRVGFRVSRSHLKRNVNTQVHYSYLAHIIVLQNHNPRIFPLACYCSVYSFIGMRVIFLSPLIYIITFRCAARLRNDFLALTDDRRKQQYTNSFQTDIQEFHIAEDTWCATHCINGSWLRREQFVQKTLSSGEDLNKKKMKQETCY